MAAGLSGGQEVRGAEEEESEARIQETKTRCVTQVNQGNQRAALVNTGSVST